MAPWGDEFDEELQNYEPPRVRFSLNIKYMSHMIGRLDEETRERDGKYPRTEFLKIWGCIMLAFFILFLFTYNVLIVVTGALYIFYAYVLFQLAGAWRRYKYSGILFWGMTIVGLAIALVAAMTLRGSVLGR